MNPSEQNCRCDWPRTPLEIAYHDFEWGVPMKSDQGLFESLILEGAQAGLSWSTILKKRARYQEAFDHFDLERVAAYDSSKIAELLADAGLVRHRLKMNGAVINARAIRLIQDEFGSFSFYVWSFVDHQAQQSHRGRGVRVPDETPHSNALSKDLQKRGFRFAGPKICAAFMQANGMFNEHSTDCFRYAELVQKKSG